MGFLEYGTPLEWAASLEYARYIREHGIQQFLAIFHRVRGRSKDVLKWGDEIEYHLVEFRPESKETRLSLTAPEVLAALVAQDKDVKLAVASSWHPEYGSWMVEATPGAPYGGTTEDLRSVQLNMTLRRYRIAAAAGTNVVPFSLVSYPLMGVGAFTSPAMPAGGPFSRSAYASDAIISPHPRFGTLTANIRHRRGEKVAIQRPLFHDVATTIDSVTAVPTASTTLTPHPNDARETIATRALADASQHFCVDCDDCDVGAAHVPKAGHIHMDAMGFGMGCCCLQVTFQARDLAESRFLYDQLAVLSPLMLALTANTPIWRGHLSDEDTRWDTIVESVDCRTPAERGEDDGRHNPGWMSGAHASEAAGLGQRRITKSRYSSIDCFISTCSSMKDEYNDIPIAYDEGAYATLLAGDVDDRLAKHIAHLFIRDPLVIFKERVYVDDAKSSEHFENIQSTNWRSVRWKPPPPDAHDMGWRVELRTMEAQLTDFENAAFTVFIVLVSRVILFFDLNLYVPLSKVDDNFRRAKRRDAAIHERFFFRRHVTPARDGSVAPADADAFDELSLRDILHGTPKGYPGLIPLIYAYLELIKCDDETRAFVDAYLQFVSARAKGELQTGAAWQRAFVRGHADYKKDSVVPASTVFDMLTAIEEIATGRRSAPELLGAQADLRVVHDAAASIAAPLFASAAASSPAADASPVPTERSRSPPTSGAAASPTMWKGPGAAAEPAASAPSTLPAPVPAALGVRMRGRSYAEEIKESSFHLPAIRELLERYSVKPGQSFYDVPAFLGADE